MQPWPEAGAEIDTGRAMTVTVSAALVARIEQLERALSRAQARGDE